jgi:hypothetical protein
VAIIGQWRYQCPRVFPRAIKHRAIKHQMAGASKRESGLFGSARLNLLALRNYSSA